MDDAEIDAQFRDISNELCAEAAYDAISAQLVRLAAWRWEFIAATHRQPTLREFTLGTMQEPPPPIEVLGALYCAALWKMGGYADAE